ncbi:hypothetical protein KW783_01185 [Candidatus Parcubacteria bacterium]|nr:hypothetical protein [Candidatus Parcubacteria bacterium]
MLSREHLEEKWWFRLLKVFYFLFFLIPIIAVIGIAVGSKPTLNGFQSTYQIKCHIDGVLRGNIKGADLYRYSDSITFADDGGEEFTRWLCSNPTVNSALNRDDFNKSYSLARDNKTIPTERNYEILIKDKSYDGSWYTVLSILAVGLFAVVVVGWMIKSIFLYVLVGEKPRNPFTNS